jgi:hypothetical protein
MAPKEMMIKFNFCKNYGISRLLVQDLGWWLEIST